ncbi:hypothetical protein CDAR_291661 [Caerostris darwini]|uniref:Tc1-like transposase DDE domain-containing protein n=1 Tax=Caerostris darwini TaxID=1538125 RepID=A0AAV4MU11_9ARAC|nr:hypothetical protein CDAR_291661 [Caerostris darwini]
MVWPGISSGYRTDIDGVRPVIVKEFLESKGIEHMVWPTYSPDLNPNENLWDAHAVLRISCKLLYIRNGD